MNYQEYKEARQREFNSLPIYFAFNQEQFAKAMSKMGLTPDDTDKIYRLGDTGGFYKKEDSDLVSAVMNKKDELPELMKDKDFAIDAFYYELCNHEYAYNYQGDYDVCSCFGECEYSYEKDHSDYLREAGFTDEIVKSYEEAKRKYYKACDENGWW